MTAIKPTPLVNTALSLNGNISSSRLSEKDIQDIKRASTNYVKQNSHSENTKQSDQAAEEADAQGKVKSLKHDRSEAADNNSSVLKKASFSNRIINPIDNYQDKDSVHSFYNEKDDDGSEADSSELENKTSHLFEHLTTKRGVPGSAMMPLPSITSLFGQDHSATSLSAISEENDKLANHADGINAGANIALINNPVIAPQSTSSTSSGAAPALPDALASAIRSSNLLDELTSTVTSLRRGDNGNDMMIQVRSDVLADTNIHISSSAKQIEVSFLTSNATSGALLNSNLTALQNHLVAICPGQFVNIKTQITSPANNASLHNEEDRSSGDLASFDQGNRGNSNHDDDNL